MGCALPSGDLPDVPPVQSEEERELSEPLVQQRPTVNEDQGAARARGDEVGADHRLAHAGRRDEHACLVGEQRARRCFLDLGQRATEA